MTQTRESYRLIKDDIGADLKNTISNQMSAGRQLRVCFDNMDFRVPMNIILKNHHNSDKHWIAHYLTFDRVPCDRLDDAKPLVSDYRAFDNINYLLSKEDLETLRQNFIVLIAQVLLEFFDFMKPFQIKCCACSYYTLVSMNITLLFIGMRQLPLLGTYIKKL